MTNKEKLKLISVIEELKEVILNSFDYKNNIKKVPLELKHKYTDIYTKIKKNSELNQFPLLSNLLIADSLTDVINGFNNSNMNEKWMWEDSYDHAISEINIVGNGVTRLLTHLDGSPIGNTKSSIKINKIQLQNFRFFTDDEDNNSFETDGKNMLIYGENGAGKSSIYKAFEFLSKIGNTNISEEFRRNKNIFNMNNNSSINFEFDNDETLDINDDSEQMNDLDFVNNLSIYMPLLDYRELLKVSDIKDKNLYDFFELLLEDYPVGNNLVLKNLKEKKEKNYFTIFEEILKNELYDSINMFLEQFKQNFKLVDISFSAGFKEILLKIEYFNEDIDDYQLFLNEARLSALAISVYFAIIKKQFNLLENDSLKILVLDDLLISLDMNNRMNLVDILKSDFSDFQIFFFTHDKGLFDIFKDKMEWKAFEIYVDKHSIDGYEVPFVKKSLTYFESAIKYFGEHDYPACANYLRKEVERLKKIKEAQEEIHNEDKILKKFKKMIYEFDLGKDANDAIIKRKLIGFKKGLEKERDSSVEIDLRNIKSITNRILNPQSHDDTSKPLYKKELEEAINIIEKLEEILR